MKNKRNKIKTMLGHFMDSSVSVHSKRIIVHFKRLGSRVSYDSFNQYVLFFSKYCTYCETNAIYTCGKFYMIFRATFS